MLSNTDERNPKPRAVCHDAAGRCSTGIIEAIKTSASRKIAPLEAADSASQSGRRGEHKRENEADDANACPVNVSMFMEARQHGRISMLLDCCWNAEDKQRDDGADDCLEHKYG